MAYLQLTFKIGKEGELLPTTDNFREEDKTPTENPALATRSEN